MTRWTRFLNQTQKDAKLWLFLVLYLGLFRIFFLFFFRGRIGPSGTWADILAVVYQGFRYDAKTTTTWMLLPFLMGLGGSLAAREQFADGFRKVIGPVYVIAFTALFIVTIGFFREYNEQFNDLVFNLYYDDAKAVLSTIWAAYHPLLNLAAVGAVSLAMLAIKNRYFSKGFVSQNALAALRMPVPARILIVLLVSYLVAAGLKGSFTFHSLLFRDAAVSADEFLNKAAPNPHYALFRAYEDHVEQAKGMGLKSFLPDGDVRRALQRVFPGAGRLNDLDAYLLKRARGPRGAPPQHIILVIMESYDAWPLLEKYRSLGLTENLKRLAREGLSLRSFLPSGNLTMPSYISVVTGLPDTSVRVNYQETSRAAFPSSLPGTFKRLGYATRLFYGGFLSWQRLGTFSRAQGFDEIYSGPHMGGRVHEWGVEDEYLFDFAVKTMDDSRPSFNLILTTSYHPPYDVDLPAKGFRLKEVPDDLRGAFDGAISLKILGHLWYADQCLGRFVRKAEAKLPLAVFAFTGDHYGRKFINANPDFFERSAVPFILYGKDALRGISFPQGAGGSHIDIGATLVELAAPKGFPYYSMGRNLLAPDRKNVGIGPWKMVGRDYLFDVRSSKFYPLPGIVLPKKLPDAEELRALCNDYYGIAWWRVKRGPKL